MILKGINSLESALKAFFTGIGLITITLLLLLFNAYHFSGLSMISLIVIIIPIYVILATKCYQQLVSPFYQITNIIEAIRLEDYSLPVHNSGNRSIVNQLFLEAHKLSDDLQQRKTRYDQNIFLVYSLIEQLDLPILVFDHTMRLSHANLAFSEFYGQPWQALKGHSCIDLGFENIHTDKSQSPNWQLLNNQTQQNWQLRHSQFQDGDNLYHLLVMTNIAKELRDTQQLSWQQIIRVLSHEVSNSLTPIHSLTQSLVKDAQLGREILSEPALQALQIIASRSKSLREFIYKYKNLGKEVSLNRDDVQVALLFSNVISLFPDGGIVINGGYNNAFVYGDPTLLELVLINLVKNAMDASSNGETIHLSFEQANGKKIIRIVDSGAGITNPDNLFVPFYTTKANGQGIGLAFSRKIIEQHGGSLSLSNRTDAQGAEAVIQLKDRQQLNQLS